VATSDIYSVPVGDKSWSLPGSFDTIFNWEYDEGRDRLLSLYSKGKQKQWDAAVRIDWSVDVDPHNPLDVDDGYIPIHGSDIHERMTEREKAELRHHFESWRFSNFLHGEQGALICASKIVQTVPDIDSKFYAATQVIDEARHVEVYSRFLHEKLEMAYPINNSLQTLLSQTIQDSRWDFTYLGMQVLIEGLALASFGFIRDLARNPLAAAINAYVMQDEARHVAFGRLALADYYPKLTQAERDEREEFVVEACYLMRDRFRGEEVWERLGLPVRDCVSHMESAAYQVARSRRLFTRIVPIIKEIGLWGPKVRRAYADMGILDLADADAIALIDDDERIAEELDARNAYVSDTIAAGQP
jgi:hypothetical protein